MSVKVPPRSTQNCQPASVPFVTAAPFTTARRAEDVSALPCWAGLRGLQLSQKGADTEDRDTASDGRCSWRPTTVGVCRETVAGEHRVALVPDGVRALAGMGLRTLVESGAGASAWLPDDDYETVGARIVTRDDLLGGSDVLVSVRPPNLDVGRHLHPGQVLIALLDPLGIPFQMRRWADDGVTALSMDLVPGKWPFAHPMDAVDSQARFVGYKAALLASDQYARPLPEGVCPGVTDPVEVLVLGAQTADCKRWPRCGSSAPSSGATVPPRTRGSGCRVPGAAVLDVPGEGVAPRRSGTSHSPVGARSAMRSLRRSLALTSSSPPSIRVSGRHLYW